MHHLRIVQRIIYSGIWFEGLRYSSHFIMTVFDRIWVLALKSSRWEVRSLWLSHSERYPTYDGWQQALFSNWVLYISNLCSQEKSYYCNLISIQSINIALRQISQTPSLLSSRLGIHTPVSRLVSDTVSPFLLPYHIPVCQSRALLTDPAILHKPSSACTCLSRTSLKLSFQHVIMPPPSLPPSPSIADPYVHTPLEWLTCSRVQRIYMCI